MTDSFDDCSSFVQHIIKCLPEYSYEIIKYINTSHIGYTLSLNIMDKKFIYITVYDLTDQQYWDIKKLKGVKDVLLDV